MSVAGTTATLYDRETYVARELKTWSGGPKSYVVTLRTENRGRKLKSARSEVQSMHNGNMRVHNS